jgi:cystathionine beta-lyase
VIAMLGQSGAVRDAVGRSRQLAVDPLEILRERRSAKWRTYPPDVVPLTVAEMDYALAPAVAAVLHEAVDRSDTGYAGAIAELGPAVAGFAARRWSWCVDPTAVTAVADVGVGVVELLRVLARGRPVVISPPVYPPFFAWVPEAGAELREVPLTRHRGDASGWRLDLPALERAFAAGAAAYLLCHPHNPVGRVHTADELTALVELAHRHGVTLISDEIHAPLVLPGAGFTPLLTVPGAADVAVTVLSASKGWNLAGLKCAAIVTASAAMADVVRKLPPDTRARVGHFGVLATLAAYTEGADWLDRLLVTLDARRTQLAGLLADRLPTLRWRPPQAGYLAWLDATALGTGNTPRDLFLDRARVALEPGLRFGSPGSGHVRLNFATGPEILDHATAAMARATADLS